MNIENKKQLATILLAAGLGLVAAVGAGFYIQTSIKEQTAELAKSYEKQKGALIAEIEDIKREVILAKKERSALQQKIKEMPKQVAATDGKSRPSEPEKTALSIMTPPGKRALTIMIDSLSAVGGLVNPGDYVDIIAHLTIKDEKKPKEEPKDITTVLFQNVQVLAVGTNFTSIGNTPVYDAQQKARSLNVTLALTAEEAGLLTFAQANGKLQLALRSPAEEQTEILQVASWDALSDFVLEKQGTELSVPKPQAELSTEDDEDSEPVIQIFRGGREL